jgi:hypothetical protein
MWLAGINTHTTLDTKSSSQAGQIPSAAGWYEHPHHIGYEKFIADRPNSKCGWLVLAPTPHWIRKVHRRQAKFQVRLAGIDTHTTLDTKRLTKFQAENFHLSALALSYRENNHGLRCSHQSGPLRIAVLLSALAPSDPALASSRERSWRIEDRRVTSFVLVFSHPEPRIDSDSGLKPAE